MGIGGHSWSRQRWPEWKLYSVCFSAQMMDYAIQGGIDLLEMKCLTDNVSGRCI